MKTVYIVTKQAVQPNQLSDVERVYVEAPKEIVKNKLESIELVHYDRERGALWLARLSEVKHERP